MVNEKTSTSQTDRKFLVTLTAAQDDMLNLLAYKLDRSKAYLVREALNSLLGSYRDVLKENTNDTTGK